MPVCSLNAAQLYFLHTLCVAQYTCAAALFSCVVDCAAERCNSELQQRAATASCNSSWCCCFQRFLNTSLDYYCNKSSQKCSDQRSSVLQGASITTYPVTSVMDKNTEAARHRPGAVQNASLHMPSIIQLCSCPA